MRAIQPVRTPRPAVGLFSANRVKPATRRDDVSLQHRSYPLSLFVNADLWSNRFLSFVVWLNCGSTIVLDHARPLVHLPLSPLEIIEIVPMSAT